MRFPISCRGAWREGDRPFDAEPSPLRAPGVAAGANGYVVKDAVERELIAGVHEVAGGGRYVNPALGARLAKEARSRNAGNRLSQREQEITGLVASGLSNREIAEKLWLSPRTVENHRLRIMRKIGASSRAELVTYALEEGLVEAPAGSSLARKIRDPADACGGCSGKSASEQFPKEVGSCPPCRHPRCIRTPAFGAGAPRMGIRGACTDLVLGEHICAARHPELCRHLHPWSARHALGRAGLALAEMWHRGKPTQPPARASGWDRVRSLRPGDEPAAREGPDRVRPRGPRHPGRALHCARAAGRNARIPVQSAARSSSADRLRRCARSIRPQLSGGRHLRRDGRLRGAGALRHGRPTRASGSSRRFSCVGGSGRFRPATSGSSLRFWALPACPAPSSSGRSSRPMPTR